MPQDPIHFSTPHDYASNYFSFGHPSDPNCQRVLGGNDFGFDFGHSGDVVGIGDNGADGILP